MTAAESSAPAEAPLLRIVSPDATAEEVAALVAVLASLGGGDEPGPGPVPEWSAPRRLHRAVPGAGPAPGRGGWRSSALPR